MNKRTELLQKFDFSLLGDDASLLRGLFSLLNAFVVPELMGRRSLWSFSHVNKYSSFPAALIWALTLKSESGKPRSWCACSSAAQTLSPVGQDESFTFQTRHPPVERWMITNLHGHSEVVPIFNLGDVELHPHRHLPGKHLCKWTCDGGNGSCNIL